MKMFSMTSYWVLAILSCIPSLVLSDVDSKFPTSVESNIDSSFPTFPQTNIDFKF